MQPDEMAGATGANWWGLAALAAIILLFAVIFVMTTLLPSRREAKALTALGVRRGWQIERRLGIGGKGTRILVRPDLNQDWQAEVARYQNQSTAIRSTEFRAPLPAFDTGMAVFGPALSGPDAAMTQSLLGGMGGTLERMLLQSLLAEAEAANAADLRLLEQFGLHGATAFATPDAEAAARTFAQGFAPLLARWQSDHPKEAAFPILILTPGRLRLRLRMAADPVQLERLIDLGLGLQGGGGR